MAGQTLFIPDAEAMERLGGALARCVDPGDLIYLEGELGAGKSTLVRGFLRRLGYAGAVTSPTYTLVEPYTAGGFRIYHFDLYRLADPEELEYLGVRDYLHGEAIGLVEWPQRGRGVLPPPTLTVSLAYAGPAREARFEVSSPRGETLRACVVAASGDS